MPDDQGRLDPNELDAIRGGAGQVRHPTTLGDAANYSLSDMLNAVVPDEHKASFEAVKQQAAWLKKLDEQSDVVFKFMKDFKADSSGNFERYKSDLGAKNFEAIFGKAIKSGDFTQGRPLTNDEKDAVEMVSFFHVAKIYQVGHEVAERFAGDVGKFRQSLGLPADF